MDRNKIDKVFLILLVACLTLLLGRAYQHIFFEAPYRAFFLDEDYFRWAIEWFTDSTWQEYVISLKASNNIVIFGRVVAVFYMLAALSLLLLRTTWWKISAALLIAASCLLLFMGVCYYLDKGFVLGQLLEYTAQISTPLFLLAYQRNWQPRWFPWLLRFAIAFTFIGHGLYALGFYPIPGHFVHMVITNLGITNAEAIGLLQFAGWMDMVVAVGIFLPYLARPLLLYAGAWGFLTALARPTTYIVASLLWLSMHQILFEFFIRTPHFLLPLAALLLLDPRQSKG